MKEGKRKSNWAKAAWAGAIALIPAMQAGAQGTWTKAAGQPFAAPGGTAEFRADLPIYRLACGAGKVLFAAGEDGLHRSANGGSGPWTHPVRDPFIISSALAADASGLVLYNQRLSRDGGLAWTDLSSSVTVIPTAFAIRGNTVVTGGYYNILFGSQDAARSFRNLRSGPDVAWPGDLEISSQGRIYSGLLTGGLFYSDDQGRTWNNHQGAADEHKTGFIPAGAENLTSLRAAAEGSLLVGYFGTGGEAGAAGLFRVGADLKAGTRIAGFPRTGVTSLVRGPRGYLFAGTWGSGVRASADGGATWSDLAAGLGDRHILALAVDGESTLHALTRDGLFSLAKAEGGPVSLARHARPGKAPGMGSFSVRWAGAPRRLDGRHETNRRDGR